MNLKEKCVIPKADCAKCIHRVTTEEDYYATKAVCLVTDSELTSMLKEDCPDFTERKEVQ
jgi:hypothetical protein